MEMVEILFCLLLSGSLSFSPAEVTFPCVPGPLIVAVETFLGCHYKFSFVPSFAWESGETLWGLGRISAPFSYLSFSVIFRSARLFLRGLQNVSSILS